MPSGSRTRRAGPAPVPSWESNPLRRPPPGEPRHGYRNVVRSASAQCSSEPLRVVVRAAKPVFDNFDSVRLLICGELASLFNVMPLRETATAARRGRVLRHEYRVPAKRSLLPIVSRFGRRQPLRDEVRGVRQNGLHAFGFQIFLLPHAQAKSPPKRRSRQRCEDIIQISRHCSCRVCHSGKRKCNIRVTGSGPELSTACRDHDVLLAVH